MIDAQTPDQATGSVFVVEDDAGNRMTAVALLEEAGYVVSAASSLADARSMVKADAARWNVALIDDDLGDGSAADLIPLLRSVAPSVKVILFSGSALRSGVHVDGFVLKGDDFSTVLSLVKKLMA